MSYKLTQTDRISIASQARDDYYNELMTTYRKKSENLSGRKFEYIKKNKDAQIDLLVIAGGGTVCGAIAGGVVGAIVGGTCGTPGGPPGMVLGAAIGAPVGAVIGAAIGTGIAVAHIRPRYQEWCKTEAGQEFAGQLSVFLNENNILEHLTCPITQMPVIEGVRTPDGQLYERSEIEEWVKQRGTNPLTQEKLHLSDLKTDEKASLESAKIFVNFLKTKREETEQAAPELMPGYDKLIQDTREAAMGVYNTKLVTLQKKWQKGEISYEELSTQSRNLGEKYLNI